jgi:ribosomal-protein-alanine N-acetyltransferase
MNPHIRWMICKDMPQVLAIESKSFEFAWDEDAFIHCLRQRNCIGQVATVDDGSELGNVVGYMIYEIHPVRLHVLSFAVHPSNQRQGVGAAMVAKLTGKLSLERRNRIMLEVRETNLDALLFFKNMGFKAISVLRDYYDDSDEDAYLMQYRYLPTRSFTFGQFAEGTAS